MKEVFFQSAHPDQQQRLADFQEYFTSMVSTYDLKVENIEHNNWQERYFLLGASGSKIILNIAYDGKGNFKAPALLKSDPSEFGVEVMATLRKKAILKKFAFNANRWREAAYEIIANKLDKKDVHIEGLLQNNYHDILKCYQADSSLEVELWYGGNGLFSKVIPRYYTETTIWDTFKSVIQSLGNGSDNK